MELKDRLVQVRKLRGMNQEELAERVGVSRQAVSKWETGEAMPDCVKLMALADALEVSMDYLCGREGEQTCVPEPAANPEPAATPEQRTKKAPVHHIILACVFAVLLLGIGLGVGLLISGNHDRTSETLPMEVTPLPDAISVEGFDFDSLGREGLSFHFVPSVINENYTYQVSLCDEAGKVQIFDATPKGGICFCKTGLKGGGVGYTITLTVSNGDESRTALLCSDLYFSESNASWTPGP